MIRFVSGVFVATMLSLGASAERAAYVYSDWSSSTFAREFDKAFAKVGWKAEKFENVRLPELSEKLADFDVVVAGSVANYTRTVQMKPYAARWRAWLENGGVLLVSDANYGSVLGSWVAGFGEGFECSCALCSAHTKKGAAARAVTVDADAMLMCPRPLGKLLTARSHWSHITRLGPGWKTPIRCSDGQPLFAYRSFGKGLVVLTVASSLKNSPVAEALLTNITLWRRLQTAGLEIVSFDPDGVKGDGAARGCRLCIRSTTGGVRKLSATLIAHNSSVPKNAGGMAYETVRATLANGETAEFKPSCAVSLRGAVQRTLVLEEGTNEITRLIWSDEVPSALALTLRRKHLYPGDELVPAAVLHPQTLGREKLEAIEWKIDDGAWTSRAARDGDWRVSVTGLAVGRHELRSRLRYADGFLASVGDENRRLLDWGEERAQEFFVHPEPTYRMRADHVLLEKGRPFFPLGFYQVSWTRTNEQRLKMVENLAAWGYNTVHVGIRGDEAKSDSYGAFLDACAKLGVRVITEFGTDALETIRRYRDKPAVMGWNPGDEPAPKGITPQEMFGRYDRFKQLDPDHLAYTVICVPAQYANYAAGTDVLAPDPYPVPHSSVRSIYERFTEAKSAANAVDTALWCVGQAFGGQRYAKSGGWKRWPNPREFRAMSYLALMAGVKGFVYYTYDDDSFNLLEAPDLLEAVKAFPSELKDVIPFILDGTAERTAEDVAGVYATVWTLGEKRLFVAVNTSDKEADAVAPFVDGKVLQGQPLAAQNVSGTLRFRLAPLERVVICK